MNLSADQLGNRVLMRGKALLRPPPHLSTESIHSHTPSIRSHRGTKEVFPDFQPMRVSEEPVCIYLFRQNPVFTSVHLRSPVHVVPPLQTSEQIFKDDMSGFPPLRILASWVQDTCNDFYFFRFHNKQ